MNIWGCFCVCVCVHHQNVRGTTTWQRNETSKLKQFSNLSFFTSSTCSEDVKTRNTSLNASTGSRRYACLSTLPLGLVTPIRLSMLNGRAGRKSILAKCHTELLIDDSLYAAAEKQKCHCGNVTLDKDIELVVRQKALATSYNEFR